MEMGFPQEMDTCNRDVHNGHPITGYDLMMGGLYDDQSLASLGMNRLQD